jgi:hypothetical protein
MEIGGVKLLGQLAMVAPPTKKLRVFFEAHLIPFLIRSFRSISHSRRFTASRSSLIQAGGGG